MEAGTLYIVATPIGNIEDISQRALETLKEADAVICGFREASTLAFLMLLQLVNTMRKRRPNRDAFVTVIRWRSFRMPARRPLRTPAPFWFGAAWNWKSM